MTPVIIWSFGAGVWFSTMLTSIHNKRAGYAVVSALLAALYILIAIALAP